MVSSSSPSSCATTDVEESLFSRNATPLVSNSGTPTHSEWKYFDFDSTLKLRMGNDFNNEDTFVDVGNAHHMGFHSFNGQHLIDQNHLQFPKSVVSQPLSSENLQRMAVRTFPQFRDDDMMSPELKLQTQSSIGHDGQP